jgi:protein gp37
VFEHIAPGMDKGYWDTLEPSAPPHERAFDSRLSGKKMPGPLRWRRPKMVFVNPGIDLFHFDVPTDHIATVFGVMAYCREHTFLVCTRRAEAMAIFLNRHLGRDPISEVLNAAGLAPDFNPTWPLSNLWLGFEAVSQKAIDHGLEHLPRCPAAVRFLRLQPLLESVTLPLCEWPTCGCPSLPAPPGTFDPACPKSIKRTILGSRDIDWVIVGGASGREALPTHPEWVRAIRNQCQAARVPFFFSEWGAWAPSEFGEGSRRIPPHCGRARYLDNPPCKVWRFGTKAAGRLLDGRTWDEMPRLDS